MSTSSRLLALLRPWLCRLPVSAGLEDLARKWEPAARAWEEITRRHIDQLWLDRELHESCRLGHQAGRDLAWVVGYSALIDERTFQAEDFASREVEMLQVDSVAAVLARGPEGAFARARQAGEDRGKRPVPRQAKKGSL